MTRFFKLSVLFLFFNLSVLAQVPKGINYQGVARLANGTPIAGKAISIKVSLLQNSPTGTIEYAETHQPTTNEFGLFTLVIGQGTVSTGDFDFISWANGNKWLQIEMDPEGASNYSLIGSQQLMSVPYSYYAQYAGNSLKAGPGLSIENNIISNTGDNDNDASNELTTSVILGADKVLRITDAGGTKQADLSVLEGTVQNLSQVLSQGTDAGAQKISNLGTPTNSSDAATKAYVDNHVDGDANPTNEIQDLNLTGNNLTITNKTAATSINLAPYLDNTDNQNLTLNPVVGTSRTVNISNGTSVTFDVADNDNSATNEIQTLSKAGGTISLTSGGSVSLNDDSNTNEIQDLNRAGNTLSLTGDVTTVDLSPYLDNTDGQTLATQTVDANTRSVSITGGNIVNVDVRDADASNTNEIQDLSINGVTNILSLTGDATTVNLSPYLDNTDNQNLSLTTPVVGTNRTININNGTNVTFDVADNDNNSNNEIQDLSLATNTLSLSGDATAVNLAPYLDNTDNQDLTISGNTLSLTNDATPINLAPYLDNTDSQNLSSTISGTDRTINISGGTGTTINVADNDNSSTNEIQNLGNTVSGTQRTITISGGSSTIIDVADNDNNSTNEIQNLTYTAGTNSLAISGGNSQVITHTLGQVLATGNDAGGLRIQNLGSPTGSNDATTRAFVENAISTNFAFKVNYAFTNAGVPVSNQLVNLGTEVFDDFNVVATNRFTVPANGSGFYTFFVDGTSSSTTLTLKVRVNGITVHIVKRSPSTTIGIVNDTQTLMLKLVANDFVELIIDSPNPTDLVNGIFFGNKL